MKILHVCNHFYPCVGGIERHVEDLCKNLIELGYQSDVVCLNTCAYDKIRLPEFEEHKGIKIFRIPYLNLKIYKLAPKVLKFIKEYGIIHIHGLGFFSDFLALTKSIHKKPLILSTHGGIFHTKAFSSLKKIYFNLFCKLTLKKINKIIAVSKSDEKLFSTINSKVEFIPNAIEIDDFSKIKRVDGKNTLLFVGRISKNKRIDNLIETVFYLKKKIPDIKLYVVGEDWGGIKGDLEELVEQKGLQNNVIFTGKVRTRGELSQYYSKARFFVSASEYEGFGISVLEAMAAGLTVIVNDIESFRDFVKDGQNGFIVDYSKPKEIATIIYNLLNSNLVQIESTARKTAKKYDWEKLIGDIEECYEEVMKVR